MPSLDPSSRPRVRNAKTPAERMRLFRRRQKFRRQVVKVEADRQRASNDDCWKGAMGAERATRRSAEAVLLHVLFASFASHHKERDTNKLLSAIRHAFGGHVEPG